MSPGLYPSEVFRGWTSSYLLSGELEQFTELADHLRVAPFLKTGGHARGEMAFEQRAFERLDGALDGVGLLEDVDAVDVLLDHFADATQVALDGRQAIKDVFLVGLHCALLLPLGEGVMCANYRVWASVLSTPSPRGRLHIYTRLITPRRGAKYGLAVT